MDPVAFDLGFMAVRWYSVMAVAAVVSGMYMGRFWAVKYGLDQDKVFYLSAILVPAVIAGGRTAFVLANMPYYRSFPGEILRIDHGGLGSHGAIVAVLIAGYFATRAMKMPFWSSADALAPALPLSYFFVRLGNFANGELFGLPTGLPSLPRHPSMLYEATGEAVILALTLRWCASRKIPGEAFLRAGFSMAVLRVLVDFTRSGLSGPIMGLVLTQALSIVMAAVCLTLLRVRSIASQNGKGSVGHVRTV